MMERYDFALSHQGKMLGRVIWSFDADGDRHGRLEGEAAVVRHLEQTIAQAVQENWEAYPQPDTETVTDPLNSFYEMMIVLEYGGYDIPDEFYPYTPKGSAERDAQFEYGGEFFVCH